MGKVFIISFRNLWVVELAYRKFFSFKFTLHCQQSDIVSFPLIATGAVDSGGDLTCEYLCKFLKKIEITQVLFFGAWGKMIHDKNLKQKIS
jgi:hypothetical protein